MGKILVAILLVGLVVYLLVRVAEKAAAKRRGGGPSGGRPAPRAPRGPDDDPEFLWKLEAERRRRRKAAGEQPPAAGPTPEKPADPAPDGDEPAA